MLRVVRAGTDRGDLDAVIDAIDDFARRRCWMMNIGPEKGAILDSAVRRCQPTRLLELGTYCGYSALRMARVMPSEGCLYSVEPNPLYARIARRVWEHAGVTDRVCCVRGRVGDGGATLRRLERDYDFGPRTLDFLFIDHTKQDYLSDLLNVCARGWLHVDSVVLADNIIVPGVPDYHAFMRDQDGHSWRTIEHSTHLEYRPDIDDLVLESRYLGEVAGDG